MKLSARPEEAPESKELRQDGRIANAITMMTKIANAICHMAKMAKKKTKTKKKTKIKIKKR